MPTTNLINQCVNYVSATSCSYCSAGFYIKDKACVKVSFEIDGCEIHSSNGSECLTCQASRTLTLDRKKCQANTSVGNCQGYSYLKCSQCKSGFMIEANAYLHKSLTDQNVVLSIMLGNYLGSGLTSHQQCVAYEVSHCATLLNFRECSLCEPGHFLDKTKQCVQFPKQAVAHCELYTALTTCTACLNEYWMESPNLCQKVTPIPDCLKYSRTADNICLECTATHYQLSSQCKLRDVTIQHCKLYEIANQLCATCDDNFQHDLKRLLCLPSSDNCLGYLRLAESVECNACSDGFYLEEKKCALGEITGCKKYTSKTDCNQCDQGYYLRTLQECVPFTHLKTLQCKATSSLTNNKCVECEQDRSFMSLPGLCESVSTVVQNCRVYKDKDTCENCNTVISYKAGGLCISGQISNCVLYAEQSNYCNDCKNDAVAGVNYVVHPISTVGNKCVPGNPNV